MSDNNQEYNNLLRTLETTARLNGEQIQTLIAKMEAIAKEHQERHQIFIDEMNLAKATRDATIIQMTQFEKMLTELQETVVALINITNDLQPYLANLNHQTMQAIAPSTRTKTINQE